jgi:hypothetical protein
MAAVQHIFNPELESSWVSSVENALDGILRVGVWECETELEAAVGWGYSHLDTFKRRIRCTPWDVDSIQEFDLMSNSFDGVRIQQSLSDRANSSFSDPPTPNSLSNPRIVSSNHLEPFMAVVQADYEYRPDLAFRLKHPYRWWTLYRKRATYTVKYAFGGNLHSGWWTPPEHDWDTYPLAITQLNSMRGLDAEFVFDGPPYVQRSEFSVQWFKYRYTFDWPIALDSGCRLDNWHTKWFQFYNVTVGYDKFNSIENLTKYDPFLGDPEYRNPSEFCFRYNVQENIDFETLGNNIQIYSDCLDGYMKVGTTINLWATLNWCGVSKPGSNLNWKASGGTLTKVADYYQFTPSTPGIFEIEVYEDTVSAKYLVNVSIDNPDLNTNPRPKYGASNQDLTGEVVILTGRLDARSDYKPIDLEVFTTSILDFDIAFGPRISNSDWSIVSDKPGGWGAIWSVQGYGE